jgi:hypothetical protein
MKILILGMPKTGTTALYSKIRNSFKGDINCIFEPKQYDENDSENVLAKVLFSDRETDYNSFLEFDKKIIIVRDLRDWIISSLLYGFSYGKKCFRNETLVLDILRLLRQKEIDPNSVSLLKIFNSVKFGPDTNFEINAHNPLGLLNRFIGFHNSNEDFFLIKYEDFVDGRLNGLEEYLGFRLDGSSEVGPTLNRVVRTKGYGNWKDWFTQEDINYFRPIFTPFMERYSYGGDWRVNVDKRINPEHCSLYALRNINEKRNNAGLEYIGFNERGIFNKIKKFLARIQFQ